MLPTYSPAVWSLATLQAGRQRALHQFVHLLSPEQRIDSHTLLFEMHLGCLNNLTSSVAAVCCFDLASPAALHRRWPRPHQRCLLWELPSEVSFPK